MAISTTPAGSYNNANTYTVLATQVMSSHTTTVTFSSIPQTYTDLRLVINGMSDGVNADYLMSVNGDTGANYSRTYLYGNGSASSSGRNTGDGGYRLVNFSNVANETNVLNFMNYSNTTTYKTVLSRMDDTGSLGTIALVGTWRSTAAISSFTITGGAHFTTGTTFTLYGILGG